jgi:hypothetical protein
MPSGTKTVRTNHRLAFLGHGEPSIERARFSQTNRVVLVAEGQLEVDKVIVYEVPFPEVFFASGGTRTIDVAVAFDPLTRYRRKDYLRSRIYPYLFLGHSTEEVLAALAEIDEDDLADVELAATDEESEPDATRTTAGKSGFAALNRIPFSPSTAVSSDSANILLRAVRRQRFDPSVQPVGHLAVRSSAQWSPPGTLDAFGVAVALAYVGTDVDIYEEIRARVEVEVEVEVES